MGLKCAQLPWVAQLAARFRPSPAHDVGERTEGATGQDVTLQEISRQAFDIYMLCKNGICGHDETMLCKVLRNITHPARVHRRTVEPKCTGAGRSRVVIYSECHCLIFARLNRCRQQVCLAAVIPPAILVVGNERSTVSVQYVGAMWNERCWVQYPAELICHIDEKSLLI